MSQSVQDRSKFPVQSQAHPRLLRSQKQPTVSKAKIKELAKVRAKVRARAKEAMTEREFCHIHAAKTPRFHCNLASNRGERPCCSDSLRSAFPGPSGLCKTPSNSPGSSYASEFPRMKALGSSVNGTRSRSYEAGVAPHDPGSIGPGLGGFPRSPYTGKNTF